MRRCIVLLFALVAFALTAFTPRDTEIEKTIIKPLSIEYTHEVMNQITVKHRDAYITDYIRVQDLMKANPDLIYITGNEANLNPSGCPEDCAPNFDFSRCNYTYYMWCGQDNSLQCWVCVYPIQWPEWRKCAVCHWG